MLEEATVQRMREAAGEEPGGAGVEAAERDGQPVPRERARVPAIAERQRRQEHATHGVWEACGPALGGVQHPEEPAPPLALGVEARRIRPPHLIGPRRDDRARVSGIAMPVPRSNRRQQVLRPYQPQYALAAHADVPGPQPRVHLAMPLAVERAGREDGADRLDQRVVVELRLRPALPAVRRRHLRPGRVDARDARDLSPRG